MMNVDIETEHVAMRPEWHREIDDWIGRCTRVHPQVSALEVTLRHDLNRRGPSEEVQVVATAGGRTVSAARHAILMGSALHDALDGLERELLVYEAVRRAA